MKNAVNSGLLTYIYMNVFVDTALLYVHAHMD